MAGDLPAETARYMICSGNARRVVPETGCRETAWDAFPEEWRRAARADARAALADFRNSIGTYPSATDLATIEVPVVCTYGARSPDSMFRLVRSLAAAIPT